MYIYSLYELCRSVDVEKLIFHEKTLFGSLPYHKGNKIAGSAACLKRRCKQIERVGTTLSKKFLQLTWQCVYYNYIYICKKR